MMRNNKKKKNKQKQQELADMPQRRYTKVNSTTGRRGGGPGGRAMMGIGAKGKLNMKTVKRLLSYVWENYKLFFCLVLFFIIISSMAGVLGSKFIQVLIDNYIDPLMQSPDPKFDGLFHALLVMGCIYVAGVISTLFYNRLMVVISQGVQKKIRDDMFARMQKLPIKYFDTHSHGDIMSHFTNDTDTLRQMLSQSIPQTFASVISIVFVFAAMVTTNVYLTVLVLLTVVVMRWLTKLITEKCGLYFKKQQEALGEVNGFIEEMIHGQRVVKVFCHEKISKHEFDELNDYLSINATRANRYANILMPIMGNIGNLLYVLIAIFGGILAVNGIGGTTLGEIAAFLQLSKSFTMPVSQIAQQLNSIVMALAGAERIFNLMDEEPEQDEGYVTLVNVEYKDGELVEVSEHTGTWAWKHPHSNGTITYTKLTGDVRFFDVDFAYKEGENVLHEVSLFAQPGEKIAFVGATGAGKTTITNLINRFYDIADGKIRYDGININKIKKSDLRHSLGIVLQDTNLFCGTVMDNIRYGKLDATEEEVYNAAKIANAHDFISRLPQGYNTDLSGDGSSLSQGQRQLLSIARAAVADPPVMILDEATSSIDTRTEAIVQRGMDSLMKGRTVFVIAHRLSTVQNSDAIIVLEHGRIIERGDHEKLIQKKGKYYQLYTGAFELE